MSAASTLAPRWRRIVALAYESLLVCAIFLVAAFGFALMFPQLQGNIISVLFVLSAVFGYFVYCWRKNGQTLAMKTWRVQLLDAEEQIITPRACAIRIAVLMIALSPTLWGWMQMKQNPALREIYWATLAFAALPWLWSLVDREKQFLHDRLAGTRLWLR